MLWTTSGSGPLSICNPRVQRPTYSAIRAPYKLTRHASMCEVYSVRVRHSDPPVTSLQELRRVHSPRLISTTFLLVRVALVTGYPLQCGSLYTTHIRLGRLVSSPSSLRHLEDDSRPWTHTQLTVHRGEPSANTDGNSTAGAHAWTPSTTIR